MLELSKLAFSAVAGIASHLCIFKHGEWHLHIQRVVLVWIVLVISVLANEGLRSHTVGGRGIGQGLAYLLVYHSCFFSSILVYRLFLHPLYHFPGPRGAAVSKLWHIYNNLSCQNHLLLDDLHKRYGDFVRTGRTHPWNSASL